MKNKTLLITLALGLGLTAALLWSLSGELPARAAPSAALHVCPSGCAYSSIQAAVDAANPGDVIKVAVGTYSDVHARPAPAGYSSPPAGGLITQVVYIDKAVTIRGGYTKANGFADPPDPVNNPTTLDAGQRGRTVFISGSIDPTVEGLRITGGDAAGLGGGLGGYHTSGGMYVATAAATIRNNWIFGNSTPDRGGGLYLRDCTPTVSGNIITANTAHSGGGVALYYSNAALRGNTVTSNTAGYGGGAYLMHSDAALDGNTITFNTADWNGGGLDLSYSDATLGGNVILANTAAWYGGGLDIYESNVTLTNDVVVDNGANAAGSALYLRRCDLSLLHTTIARNSGGDGSGIYVADWKGIYNTVALTNTIMANHAVGISVTAGNTVTVNAILWDPATPTTISYPDAANVTVRNQYTGDPAFAPDGYHVTLGSAALDRGRRAGLATDVDGDSRPAPAGTRPDLGADEISQRRVYLPLVTRN